MYECTCGNKRNFTERCDVKTHIILENWEQISSYDDRQSSLVEVICDICWDSSEDEVILVDWKPIYIN